MSGNKYTGAWLRGIFSKDFFRLSVNKTNQEIPSHSTCNASLLEKLSDDNLTAISRHLSTKDLIHLSCINKDYHTKIHNIPLKIKITSKFQRLIAIETENNQNAAEKILKKYADDKKFISTLITKKTENMHDAAGREFLTPISCYGYAYWSGDTHMRAMMEQYMDENTKYIALQECKHIREHGISYRLNDNIINQSKHFDPVNLLTAYTNFEIIHSSTKRYLTNIGLQWREVPTHLAQEMCSTRKFDNNPDFTQPMPNRTTRFYVFHKIRDVNHIKKFTVAYVFSSSGVNSGLGTDYSLFKDNNKSARCVPVEFNNNYAHYSLSDDELRSQSRVIDALCTQRFHSDLANTIDYLATQANDVTLDSKPSLQI